MRKRTVEKLLNAVAKSRLDDVLLWYGSFKPAIRRVPVYEPLFNLLRTNPEEAAECGFRLVPGPGHETRLEYRGFELYSL